MSSKGEPQKLKRGILRAESKGPKQVEAYQKSKENFIRRRIKIEELFENSVANQIYIFPKMQIDEDFSQTDSEGLDKNEEILIYDLKCQNKRDKNYQTSALVQQRDNMLLSLRTQNLILKKRVGTESQQSLKENYDSKNQTNTSSYQTRSRKQKQQQKTSANSSKKLLFVPQVRDNYKKPSETIIVSFRGKHADRPSSRINKSELR